MNKPYELGREKLNIICPLGNMCGQADSRLRYLYRENVTFNIVSVVMGMDDGMRCGYLPFRFHIYID